MLCTSRTSTASRKASICRGGHQRFLERKNFQEVEENAQQNLGYIRSVREQLEQDRQSPSLNELKVVYIGLNFLRDDLDAPARPAQRKTAPSPTARL